MKEDGNSSATWNSTNSVIDVTYKGYETTINPNTGAMTALAKINSSSQDNSSNNNNNNNNNSSLVTITAENVNDYLGKIVTNYKTPNSTEQVTIDENPYTVSTTYRLYYVDFDNKYGDGAGTIYLKADSTNNEYRLCVEDTWEIFAGNFTTSKIRQFNPLLYSDEENQPDTEVNAIKQTAWLLDPTKWSGLVTSGSNTSISSKIKYIVGAPSVEMMMDSYNTYYGLTDSDIDYNERTEETTNRTKLLYRAPSHENYEFGYRVGPDCYQSEEDPYSCGTSYPLMLSDDNEMYYSGTQYWLASPTEYDGDDSMLAVYSNGWSISYTFFGDDSSFSPVVAIDSDVQLEFAE